MELSLKIAWTLLALAHVIPAMSAIAPNMVEKLYGVAPNGDIGVLLVHRGALFLVVCVTALYAMFDPDSRRLASVILTISMVGFLIIYARAGMVPGALRKIAIADLLGLVPLIWVSVHAWR